MTIDVIRRLLLPGDILRLGRRAELPGRWARAGGKLGLTDPLLFQFGYLVPSANAGAALPMTPARSVPE